MAALLLFHILGMYPVPSSAQLLIGSPLVSKYTLKNDFFGTSTTVEVDGFDPTGVQAVPPNSSRILVESVTINGIPSASRCWISFEDLVARSSRIVIKVTNNIEKALGCGQADRALPDSLGTGGFTFWKASWNSCFILNRYTWVLACMFTFWNDLGICDLLVEFSEHVVQASDLEAPGCFPYEEFKRNTLQSRRKFPWAITNKWTELVHWPRHAWLRIRGSCECETKQPDILET